MGFGKLHFGELGSLGYLGTVMTIGSTLTSYSLKSLFEVLTP